MNVNFNQVDLGNCDREPIHQLGLIQPFGVFLAINNDWFVAQRSVNADTFFGSDRSIGIGEPLSAHFAAGAMQRLREGVAALQAPDQMERLFGIDLFGTGDLYDCAVHYSGTNTNIEIEPHVAGDVNHQLALLRPIMVRLERQTGLTDLLGDAARQVRGALGMDRVMIYRFHDDLSGEVVAESMREDLESFHGLRYPKSDIPAQARALYVRNRFRIISDIDAQPVPIEPGTDEDGQPIDLSSSTLRAVSPIHLEYLRNMGVQASLSISIVIDGKLWGLFACHHYSPRLLPYSQRTAAELFSELFSLVLERVLAGEREQQVGKGRAVHDRLMRDFVAGTRLTESLPALAPVIREVIPHDGISIFIDDVYVATGAAPNEEEFRVLVPSLNATATSRVLARESLARHIPKAERFTDRAVGALVIPVSRTPRDFLVLWRRELARHVTWAGNPEKPLEHGPNGARLTPRKSFEAWQETVEGVSAPWTSAELQIAESLRITLLEIILRVSDDTVRERRKAQEKQELLIAELNHRVRNILNLIRGLINQSRGEAGTIEEFAQIVGGRISALAMAHDNITRGNWSPAPLRELIRTEIEAYVGAKQDRISVEGPDVLVAPEAYTVLSLVIHELITNSVKYGALSDSTGRITVTVVREDTDWLTLHWKERGGPPVKPPSRRGFGSTIIERSIPFELKGEAEVEYRLSGLEARFAIPANNVEWDEREIARPTVAALPRPPADGPVPATALLVEDSMIIALDTEDCLRELGVTTVETESTVTGALASLKRQRPEIAILDFNLGTESSEEIALELKRQGVVFWLATGYGEMADRLEELGAAGLLAKPYGKDELRGVLARYAELAAGV